MSAYRALVFVAGVLTQIASGDTLAVNAVDAQSATTLSIGSSTASAITIGSSGITTTNAGALAVTGTTTHTGATYLDGGADRSTSASWSLFASNGTSGTIGRSGQTVTFPGNLTVTGTFIGGVPTPIFVWGSNSPSVGSGSTRYMFPGYMNSGASTSVIPLVMPRAGSLRNLFFIANAAGTGSGAVSYTVYKGATIAALTATALTISVSMTATTASDTTHNFAYAQGDVLALVAVGSGTVTTSPTNVTVTAESF